MTPHSPHAGRGAGRRAASITRGLLAMLALLAAVAGVPWLLIGVTGNPIPAEMTSRNITGILTTPDDGSLLVGLITLTAWTAWLIFTISVGTELVAVATRQRIQLRLPGLGLPQRVAAALIILIASMIMSGPQPVGAQPAPPQRPAATAPTSAPTRPSPHPNGSAATGQQTAAADAHRRTTSGSHQAPDPVAGAVHAAPDRVVHTVQPGDDLWSLAEQYYGHGSEWRRISAANPDLLTGGPDRLLAGWHLQIPTSGEHTRHIRVSAGDSLSAIAERAYGDATRWREIFEANRGSISDPDLITPGQLLRVPDGTDQDSDNSEQRKAATQDQNESTPGRHSDRGQHSQQSRESSHPTSRQNTGRTGTGQVSDRGDQSNTRPGIGPSGSEPRPGSRQGPVAPGSSPEPTPTAGVDTPPVPIETLHGTAEQTTASVPDLGWRLAGVTGLLAAGLVTGVVSRRAIQLHSRPVGRRIPQPATAAQHVEARLGRRQRPESLQLLDTAVRAIGAHAVRAGADVPTLIGARIDGPRVELIMTESGLAAPAGFDVHRDRWRLHTHNLPTLCDAAGLSGRATTSEAPHPYPALLTIGTDADGTQLLVNLEHAGLLSIGRSPDEPTTGVRAGPGAEPTEPSTDDAVRDAPSPADPADAQRDTWLDASVVAAMISSTVFNPWATEAHVTVVGDHNRWASAIDQDNVTAVDDLDQLLERWEGRASVQRERLEDGPARSSLGQVRIDPDAGEAWTPEIALIGAAPRPHQLGRLRQLLGGEQPPVALAAVVVNPGGIDRWRLTYTQIPGSAPTHAGASDRIGGDTDVSQMSDSAAADVPDTNVWAVLEPLGWRLVPQRLSGRLTEHVHELLAATGSTADTPAPWWAADFPPDRQPAHALSDPDQQGELHPVEPGHDRASAIGTLPIAGAGGSAVGPDIDDDDADAGNHDADAVDDVTDAQESGAARPSDPAAPSWPSAAAQLTRSDEPRSGPPPNVTPINSPAAHRRGQEPSVRNGTTIQRPTSEDSPSTPARRASEESDIVSHPVARSDSLARSETVGSHPILRLIGPVELVGGTGDPPRRAARQCIEYCAWLLEHPGSSARAMASGLVVAEGTRRSNMSRLRSWLGFDDRGEPYLPDAYSGRITLSPLVSSDWHRLQLICSAGVNRTSTEGLCRALQLVRGAPLADAAPGQWHWAEEMRTDMISVLRDIGVELTERALDDADIDLARWAAARALTAAAQDELLTAARIRTEHLAGNPAEVERLSLQLAAQSRTLGLDLNPETVDLLQHVLEGGLRARA